MWTLKTLTSFLWHDHIYPLCLKIVTVFREGWNYDGEQYFSYFTHCYGKDPIKATQKRLDLSSELRGKARQGGEIVVVSASLAAVVRTWGSWSHCICSQEADRNARWCSACFFIFWSFYSVQGLSSWAGADHIQGGSSLPVIPLWKHLHWHAQRCVS